MSASTEIDRVHALVAPIAADLQLDVYDIERRGATVRITLDTPPGSDGGITLDSLSLATRLISASSITRTRSPGTTPSRSPAPGSSASCVRQRTSSARSARPSRSDCAIPRPTRDGSRARLTAADERTATLLLDDGTERIVPIDDVDKARTVFEWGPKPKPGKQPSRSTKKAPSDPAPSDQAVSDQAPSNKEKQAS